MRTISNSAQAGMEARWPESGPAPRDQRESADDDLQVAVLARTIEYEIIPRLMLAHRAAAACIDMPVAQNGVITDGDIEMFTRLVLSPEEELAAACIQGMRQSGLSAEDICLGMLAPVARRLGDMWLQDLVDFTDVTFGLGRLERILRGLGPAFEQPPEAPANGRRILLLPAPGEQHTFGVVMVAEFFRRSGWHVEVGLAERGTDAVAAVRGEWFDVVGISVGCEAHLQLLRGLIASLRNSSCNPSVGIMVGGPLVMQDPELAAGWGADVAAGEGKTAPALAEGLVASRAGRR